MVTQRDHIVYDIAMLLPVVTQLRPWTCPSPAEVWWPAKAAAQVNQELVIATSTFRSMCTDTWSHFTQYLFKIWGQARDKMSVQTMQLQVLRDWIAVKVIGLIIWDWANHFVCQTVVGAIAQALRVWGHVSTLRKSVTAVSGPEHVTVWVSALHFPSTTTFSHYEVRVHSRITSRTPCMCEKTSSEISRSVEPQLCLDSDTRISCIPTEENYMWPNESNENISDLPSSQSSAPRSRRPWWFVP